MNEQSNAPQEPEIKQPETPEVESSEQENEHRRELGRGILIFVGLNGLMFLVSAIFVDSGAAFYLGWFAMLLNLVVLSIFAKYRKGVAGGILGAFTFMVLLTFILAPIFWFSVCWSQVGY